MSARHARRRTAAGALATLLLLAACGSDAADEGPRPAYILLAPEDTVLAPGDTVRLRATAFDMRDQAIPATASDFRWRSLDSTIARVDSAGLVSALATGDVRVEARNRRTDVRGFAGLRVRRISGFEPVNGAFGAIVTFHGRGFAADAGVRFGGGVDAFVRAVAGDGTAIEAWVPVGALSGPLTVLSRDSAFVTEDAFFVTGGGDDALEPNGLTPDFEQLNPAPLEFPFFNPSLVVRPVLGPNDPDVYRFELPSDGALRVDVLDRSALIDLFHSTRLEVIDLAALDLVGLVSTYAPVSRDTLRPATISNARLRAGSYEVVLTPFAFTRTLSTVIAGERSYGLQLDRDTSFARTPDGFEPNDYPRQAATLDFPVARNDLVIENPYGADYYAVQLTGSMRVVAELRTIGPGPDDCDSDLDLFLTSSTRDGAPAKSIPWIVANGEFPDFYFASLEPCSSEYIETFATLPAGTYYVAVLDVGGNPIPYQLNVDAAPTGPPTERATKGAPRRPPEKPALWAAAQSPRLYRRR